MSRRHALTTQLLTRLLILLVTLIATIIVTVTVTAQSNIPTKLGVSSPQRSVGVREPTELRIRLIDQAGNELAAPYNMTVTLIATRQKDIDTAKRDGKGNIGVQKNGTLALPNGVSTVQTNLTIYKGHSAASLQFSSHQAGLVRIYAENEKLITGATLIAVVVKTVKTATRTDRMADAAIFQQASFQERMPAAPVAPPMPAATATDYQLVIEGDGKKDAELIGDKGQMRGFTVQLTSGRDCVPATQQVEVLLSFVKGGGEFSQRSFFIPKDQCIYPVEPDKFIELRTKSGGDIEVEARVVRREGISVKPSPVTKFDFKTTIRATKLLVTATKQVAMANGIESIDLIIRPVDDGNNMVSNDDEKLDVRNITLSVATRALGLKFENEARSIQMKRGENFIVTSVTSSCPVAGAKIVAEAENGDRQMIRGEQKLEFCFPWTQLGSAMLGGLMFPLMITVFPGKLRERLFAGGKLKLISIYGALGLFLGAVAFAVVFFGALGLTEFNFNGIPVTIARLPVHNWLAAIVIGFLGAAMLVKGLPLKGHTENDASDSGESPAQA